MEPLGGDDIRAWGPPFWGSATTAFLSFNRNKRSVALDVKRAEGQEVLWELASQADVLVQNLRPGSLGRLGFDYESVRKRNPRIIYCSMTAYGSTGPMRDMPGYDPLLQAYSGLMSVTGESDGPRVRVGTSIVDMGTGMWAAIGILAALLRRRDTDVGQLLETSLYETALNWIPYQIMGYLATGDVPRRHGSGLPILAPYEAYPTRDGQLLVAVGNNGHWLALCRAIDLSSLVTDARYVDNPSRVRNRGSLNEHLTQRLRTRTSAEWLGILRDASVPCSPLHDIGEAVNDPQTEALGILRSTTHPDIPGYLDLGLPLRSGGDRPATRLPPPALGQHTREVLRSLGRTDAEIDHLVRLRVVAEG